MPNVIKIIFGEGEEEEEKKERPSRFAEIIRAKQQEKMLDMLASMNEKLQRLPIDTTTHAGGG
jgi:hypothetical protein